MEQTKYYYIPKERIINLLDRPATFNGDGTITMSLLNDPFNTSTSISKATLSDYVISSNIVVTPILTQYIGKLGTKIVLWGWDQSMLETTRKNADRVLKQYEL